MKRSLLFSFILLSFALLSGCAGNRGIYLSNEFDENVAQEALEKGDNTIRGSALFKKEDGSVITSAGEKVNLIPVTPYSTERMSYIYRDLQTKERDRDPKEGKRLRHPYGGWRNNVVFRNDNKKYYIKGKKTILADALGFFTFKNVKDGEYYITAPIFWKEKELFRGGALMKKVAVSGGEEIEIVLAPM